MMMMMVMVMVEWIWMANHLLIRLSVYRRRYTSDIILYRPIWRTSIDGQNDRLLILARMLKSSSSKCTNTVVIIQHLRNTKLVFTCLRRRLQGGPLANRGLRFELALERLPGVRARLARFARTYALPIDWYLLRLCWPIFEFSSVWTPDT